VELLSEGSNQLWQIVWPEPHFAANKTLVVDLSQREQWDLFWVAGILLFELEPAIEVQCRVPHLQQHRHSIATIPQRDAGVRPRTCAR
jgi:hypothetical protein